MIDSSTSHRLQPKPFHHVPAIFPLTFPSSSIIVFHYFPSVSHVFPYFRLYFPICSHVFPSSPHDFPTFSLGFPTFSPRFPRLSPPVVPARARRHLSAAREAGGLVHFHRAHAEGVLRQVQRWCSYQVVPHIVSVQLVVLFHVWVDEWGLYL